MRKLFAIGGVLLALVAGIPAGAAGQATPVASPGLGAASPVAATPVAVGPGDPAVIAELQELIDGKVAAAPGIPGLLLHVAAPTAGIEWAGAAGVADRASGEPLTPGSTFRIASNTKTFTASATLRLVEEGAIALDQPIAELLSAESVALLTDGGYDPAAIPVRDLLTHTSGLYDYATDPGYPEAVLADPTKRWTRAEQVRFAMEKGAPLGAPGAVFGYSDTGYVLLGEIVERASGLPLAAAYRELLGFERLGLRSTSLETLEPIPAGAPPRAHQYLGEIDATGLDPSFDLYGGGGLVSSVEDLGRFYRALFRGEVFRDPATLETMLTAPPVADEAGAAMGLFRYRVGGEEPCWGHGGFWGSEAIHCPARDFTLAFSINQAEPGDDFAYPSSDEVFAIVFGG